MLHRYIVRRLSNQQLQKRKNKEKMSNFQRELVEIFDSSQDSIAGHAKLIKKCQTLYKEVPVKNQHQVLFLFFSKIWTIFLRKNDQTRFFANNFEIMLKNRFKTGKLFYLIQATSKKIKYRYLSFQKSI